MNKLNRQLSLFSVLALVASQPQSLWATSTSSSAEEIDSQKPQKSIPSQPFDLLQDTLQKINNGQYFSIFFLKNFAITHFEELKKFESKITPEDDLFDSWIRLIVDTSILKAFPENFHFDDCLKVAKERGKHEKASPAAQYNLGAMYQYGCGVAKDFTEASKYYQLAAKQGYADAQNKLGYMYEFGDEVDQDSTKAFQYYQLAADQGHAVAQYNLGRLYLYGKGVVEDHSKTFYYDKLSAKQGYARAQCDLGTIYEAGIQTDQNFDKARKYYERASNQGNASATFNLASMYKYDLGTPKNLKKAIQYYEKAVNQGHKDAYYNIGLIYKEETSTEKDFGQSLKWLLAFSKNNDDVTIDDIEDLVTFMPSTITIEDEKNLISNQETLKNNIEPFLGLHEIEKGVNKPNSSFKENMFAIPSLYKNYSEIVDFEEILLKVIHASDQSGFMVTCLQPNDIEAFKSSNCPDIKYHEIQGKSFLTFGQNNIKAADRFMTIFDTTHPVYDAISEILGALTEIHKSFETEIEMSDVAQALKTQYVSRLTLNAENKTLGTIQISANHTLLMEKVKQDIDVLTQLQAIPQQLIDLLIGGAPVRNRIFLQNNDYIEPIFED